MKPAPPRGRGRPRLAEGDETEKVTVYLPRPLVEAMRARGRPGAVLRQLAERELGGLVWIDDRRRRGRPCLHGTSIPIEMLIERRDAGEEIASIAEDYGHPEILRLFGAASPDDSSGTNG